MSLCRPGDEILVSDNVYGPTKEISQDLMKEFNINAKFYDPDSFEDLKKDFEKTKIILVENQVVTLLSFKIYQRLLRLRRKKKFTHSWTIRGEHHCT